MSMFIIISRHCAIAFENGKPADEPSVFLVYVSAKQLFFARDTGQQRAFTCAVCTDQTYVVALVHVQIDIGKYDCISVTKLRRRYLQ